MPYSALNSAQEITRKNGNIFLAIAQRRNEEGNYVQPIEKILAKSAAGDFLLEVFIGGGDHANVHVSGLVRADAFEALFFQHAQHFGLRAQAHVSHFIEKQRAAIGFCEICRFCLRWRR